MKHLLLFLLFLTPVSHADEGGASPGGGGECERRLQNVIGEVGEWLDGGGPAHFTEFQNGDNPKTYTERMRAQLPAKAHVTCVTEKDVKGSALDPSCTYPVNVKGTPKECINFVKDGAPHICCDEYKAYSKFKDPQNEASQYNLMHHELASLAKLEPHDGPTSTYFYTNQIDAFVGKKMMNFLSIKPVTKMMDFKVVDLKKEKLKANELGVCPKKNETQNEIKITGRDAQGRLRITLSQFRCPSEAYQPIYRLKIHSLGGGSVETSGFLQDKGLKDGMKALGQTMTDDGMFLEGMYSWLVGHDCIAIRATGLGKPVSYGECPFSDDSTETTGEGPMFTHPAN